VTKKIGKNSLSGGSSGIGCNPKLEEFKRLRAAELKELTRLEEERALSKNHISSKMPSETPIIEGSFFGMKIKRKSEE